MKPIATDFYLQDTVTVARQLIGTYLVRRIDRVTSVGRIVETEAYREDEPASHSFRGQTERTAPMFRSGGIAYVYLIYGMHCCFNVVTEPAGVGCAVLVRAIEPTEGVEAMWTRRFPQLPFSESEVHTIANGPGKLCRAMDIDRNDNGVSLGDGDIILMSSADPPRVEIKVSRRIGITKAQDRPWRFTEKGSLAVSGARRKRSSSV